AGGKMVDILLSLKWDGHKTAFLDSLKNYREKSSYTDATLAVEGKFYPVHKLVLSSCSQYLCDIFESTPCKSPVIVLKDVRSNDIEALLDYIYLGEVNINQNCLESFMKTAESLSIKGLASLVINNDPTKTSQIPSRIHVDACDGSPPPKRRRHDSSTALYKHVNTQTKKLLDITSNIDQDEPPIVKVEMEDVDKQQVNVTTENSYEEIDDIEKHEEDITREMSYEIDDIGMQEENITMENSYYENIRVDQDHSGYYGSDLSNTQHEPENVGNNSFLAPSVQQNLSKIRDKKLEVPSNINIRDDEDLYDDEVADPDFIPDSLGPHSQELMDGLTLYKGKRTSSRKRIKINLAKKEEIIRLHNEGKTNKEISKLTDFPHSTVSINYSKKNMKIVKGAAAGMVPKTIPESYSPHSQELMDELTKIKEKRTSSSERIDISLAKKEEIIKLHNEEKTNKEISKLT
ncbi:unnamed protein product, partial [Meganyctiphanes norvegica]